MRLGVTPPVEVTGAAAAVEISAEAERLGYTDVWTAEVGAVDAFTPLAAVAQVTERVRLGTALAPVFTRPPALIAMSAAALQSMSGGRFVLGVGASSPVIVGSWMGQAYDRPVERVREYVVVLREMLAGRKVSHDGATVRVDGFRLQIDPGAPVPIEVGALGPRMLRVAGELADGVQFFLMTPEAIREATRVAGEAAVAAGRDPDALDVFVRLPVTLDEPDDLVRFMARRLLTSYAITPAYNASLRRQGFDEQARAILDAWTAGDRDRAAASFTDEMLERFYLFGDADTSRRRIEEYRAAGVSTPVLMPISFAGTVEERSASVRHTIEALAPATTGARV